MFSPFVIDLKNVGFSPFLPQVKKAVNVLLSYCHGDVKFVVLYVTKIANFRNCIINCERLFSLDLNFSFVKAPKKQFFHSPISLAERISKFLTLYTLLKYNIAIL